MVAMHDNTSEHLTIEQVAAMVGRATTTIRRWERAGRITGVRVLGRLRYRRSEVEQLLRPEPRGTEAEVR